MDKFKIEPDQKAALRHMTGGRLDETELDDLVTYIENIVMAPTTLPAERSNLMQLTGKVIGKGAEQIIVFKVAGHYYPATDHNCNVMDTYLHTGDDAYLAKLLDEVKA